MDFIMKKLTLALFALFTLTTTAHAADLNRGKQLHDQNCMTCHAGIMGGDANSIYTRDNRRIESYDALVRQVGRCKDNLGVAWPESEVRDVAAYLNHEFYHFKKSE
jgi:mono/diheme cytochrome c family protein